MAYVFVVFPGRLASLFSGRTAILLTKRPSPIILENV
jgi:hypothetical protein